MSQLLSKCIAFAAMKHADQLDKSGQPYILHPLRVMSFLEESDIERKCIAVLHDVIEDTDATYDDLRALGCSSRIIVGVRTLTKNPGETEEHYLAGILCLRDAMYVKLADLRHNMDLRRLKGVTDKDLARMAKYAKMYHTIKLKLSIGKDE